MTRTKPEEFPYIAWIDLETTGNRDDDRIIEVGFVLTDRDLNEVIHLTDYCRPWGWEDLRARMAEPVVEMHTKNGLLFDIESIDPMEMSGPGRIDRNIAAVLFQFGGGNHVPLAGSGVSHFDRKYIRREMPLTDSLLSYWAYDIGAVRRYLRWWGIEVPEAEQHAAKKHRALDDVREHIAEAKAIRDALRRQAGFGQG